MEDCERMGIEVVAPDVNYELHRFQRGRRQDSLCAFGDQGVRRCDVAFAIEQERKKHGPFKDIFDFCERVDPSDCNKSAIETLIKAGAMDWFGAHRSQLTAVIERAVQAGAAVQADKKSGQGSLVRRSGRTRRRTVGFSGDAVAGNGRMART